MKKKIRLALLIIYATIGTLILIAATFFFYLNVCSNRIGDKDLAIDNNQTETTKLNNEYSVVTYNIGFGAYDRDYSFFLDEGILKDGTKTQGKYGKATSKNAVNVNTNGAISVLESLNADFMLLEEVDTNSTRSYGINQKNRIVESFTGYSYTYAVNFHSGFLPYPLHDMHGVVNAGLLTLSNKAMKSSRRIGLPVDMSFPNKFFDLDRCINVVRYDIEESDNELVMVTVHLSAYDEGGVYRTKQLNLLNNLLKDEYSLGNYVVVGGDFNHVLAGTEETFPSNQLMPDWLQYFPTESLSSNYSIAASLNAPTCRGSDVKYDDNPIKVVIDGYIVSDNIKVNNVTNIDKLDDKDISFMYSDHNAVLMKFELV